MFLSYDGIVFDMLFLDGWQIEADKSSDDVDFLRWHHIIDVTCVMNPAATAAFKFPPANVFSSQLNKQRGNEALNRMVSKTNNNKAKLKSGQVPGEDTKKSKLKSPESFGFGNNTILDFFRRFLPFVTDTVKNLPPTTTLPSGKVSTSAAPVPPGTGVESRYSYWDRVTESLKYAAIIGSQQGSVYINPTGGPITSEAANISPFNGIGKAIVDIAAEGAAIVGGAAVKIAENPFGAAAGAASAAGIGIVGGIVGGIAGSLQGWWADVQKQLEDLGKTLGISRDDIFGGGRQPLQNPQFQTEPQKRQLNAPPPNVPGGVGSSGWSVPATFQELHNRLNQPRRTLAIWLNTGPDGSPEFMLVSPYTGLTCDALSGPTCRLMHIPAIHGNVTGILKLRFETWVAPPPSIVTASEMIKGTVGLTNNRLHTPQFGQSQPFETITPSGAAASLPNPTDVGVNIGAVGPKRLPSMGHSVVAEQTFLLTPPLISNRWTMRQVPDEATHLNTTIIEGTAHFRMDVLQALQLTPDQLRPFFMHPIPFGYVRMPPQVTVLSDGASVQYQIVDVQQMMNNPGGQRWGIHSVKAKQVMQYSSPMDFVRTPFALPSTFDMLPKLGLFGV